SELEASSGSRKKGSNTHISTVTSHVTSLMAGGNISATAGGDALLVGTVLDSGGSVNVSAAGDLILAAAQDIYQYDYEKRKKGFLSKKQTNESIAELVNHGVRIGAKDEIN